MDMVNYGYIDLNFVADYFKMTSSRQFGVFEVRVESPIPDYNPIGNL